jgi:Fe-S cluster assembly scaffold protein SufB
MRTRGISEKDARQILTFAFVAEALEKITVPSLYEKSKALVEAKLNITLSIEQ